MTKNVIEIRKLKKVYDGRTVLKNVSFSVKKGSIHGFIGPNGAGKTTTLKCLMSGIIPSAGEIYLEGKKVGENELANKKIGFMTEPAEFTDNLSPDILVLDEPTSGLDPSYRGILLNQLEGVRKRGGTVLISSHILSDLQKLVDSTTIIDKGKIIYTGEKPDDIEEMYNKLVLKDKIKAKEGQT
ncbi:3308_t:CDS:2 [Ambispora gerdemannii]|uniref:3308_t:CDS:1 n=1 Tax=Ambispora gerdemannii TaxID=144530 RepID=A0A9N9C1U4_9GLOM|nr:3308_t:CDS:2 [Ambispora gerdemannii]